MDPCVFAMKQVSELVPGIFCLLGLFAQMLFLVLVATPPAGKADGARRGASMSIAYPSFGTLVVPPCSHPFLSVLPTPSLSICFLLCVFNGFNQPCDVNILI